MIGNERDRIVLEGLVRKWGSEWVLARLLDIGGPQLILLHLGTTLMSSPRTQEDAFGIFDLIRKLDALNGWAGSLDLALGDLHASGFPHEPLPRVIRGFRLDYGDDTAAVLEALRAEGYSTSEDEVYITYEPDADPYIGTEAADLQERIFDLVPKCASRELSNDERIEGLTYLWS